MSINWRSRFVRLAIYLTVYPVLIVIALAGLSVDQVDRQLTREVDLRINDEIAALAEIYAVRNQDGLVTALNARTAMIPNMRDRLTYRLETSDGTLLFGQSVSARLEDAGSPAGSFFEYGDMRHRVTPLSPDLRLMVASTTQERANTLRRLFVLYLFAILAIFILSLLTGIWTARHFERRLKRINATIDQVADGQIDKRVDDDNTGDEISGLSQRINVMLDRLGRLITLRKQIADQVAHEIRTPLTRMDTALAKAAGEASESEAIQSARVDIQQSVALLDGLLDISALEAQKGDRVGFAPVDLSERLRELCDFYGALAEDKSQTLSVDAPAPGMIFADSAQIDRLLGNLLSNAIKYTPENGLIEARTLVADGTIELIIADSGPGIPADRRQEVFRPFFRAESPKSRSTSSAPSNGHGLGLALVVAIIDRHDASISISESGLGGALFRVTFDEVPSNSL